MSETYYYTENSSIILIQAKSFGKLRHLVNIKLKKIVLKLIFESLLQVKLTSLLNDALDPIILW
jgi:hypothetical protein